MYDNEIQQRLLRLADSAAACWLKYMAMVVIAK